MCTTNMTHYNNLKTMSFGELQQLLIASHYAQDHTMYDQVMFMMETYHAQELEDFMNTAEEDC